MTIKFIADDFNKKIYNAAAAHPLQSWEWGDARKELGLEVIRIGEFDENNLVNVYQLTLHPVPHTPYKIGYLPRSKYPSKEILKFLVDIGGKYNLIFIKFEPNEAKAKLKHTPKDFNIHQSPHPLFPQWTQVLDISRSEQDLMNNMKSKTRYNVKLAEKKGVRVKEESTDKGFQIFSKLYFDTCKRQKYFGHNQYFHDTVWKHLKTDISHILTTYFNGTPLASYELFCFNNTFYYTYGGTSLEYRNLMGANLLMWEAIKLGKKLGATSFDMWGSLPPNYDPTHPWAGFTRFKEGYGTEFVEMIGSYDLVIKPMIYPIYNTLYKIREYWLQISA